MTLSAYRAGPALIGTSIPHNKRLGSVRCAICGLLYKLVITEGSEIGHGIGVRNILHIDMLANAVTTDHEAGHNHRLFRCDGYEVTTP